MQHVRVKVHAGVATITMDRPDSRNALDINLITDLQTAFSDVHQEKRVKAIVFVGSGNDFCSGIDLKVLAEIAALPQHESLEQWFALWREFTELLEQILRCPKVVVAAIDGTACGAGLALALASDMMVLSQRAKLSANAVNLGLVGGATTTLLEFRLGGAIASRLALSGDEIDADRTFAMGVCDTPVPVDQIWVAANELATRCTEAPLEAIQANKRLLNEGVGERLFSQLSAAAADSATACTTESATEGIRAFLENRPPQWP
ncbi:enoyl-CoA hydratase/isomerase family protein [Planctomycetes bacterium K23_9]